LVTMSKTRLSVAVRFSGAVQSAPQALKADRDDPVDNDALGRTREGPLALRVQPHWWAE
jgi:hypothetical protein